MVGTILVDTDLRVEKDHSLDSYYLGRMLATSIFLRTKITPEQAEILTKPASSL